MTTRRRYQVLAAVGRGGMGTVFHARLRGAGDFEKDVAVKLLNDDLAPEAEDVSRRLRDEARILGLIRHRAIVGVDGLARLSGRWAVVMEYVDGVDLVEIHELFGAIPVGPALEVVSEVAGALAVAYQTPGPDGRPLKLLHRDIKPANIRITLSGDVKVLDFGVAKGDFDTREAETKHVSFGSIGYVPQERIDGVDVPAGDTYSLGIVLYEMLSGERFGQTHLSHKRHDERVAEKLEALVDRGVPRRVRDLIREMTHFEPDERPAARDVERRATQLRSEVPGVLLRDWAEQRVPDLQRKAREKLPESGLTGQTLLEDFDSDHGSRPHSIAVAAPPPNGGRLELLLGGALGVVVLMMLLGTLAAVALGGVLLGRNW